MTDVLIVIGYGVAVIALFVAAYVAVAIAAIWTWMRIRHYAFMAQLNVRQWLYERGWYEWPDY
jgi:hypothetical protein